MPETKPESVVFTAITAWIMVYIMTLYNSVLNTGNFDNYTFLDTLKNMWIEYIIIFLSAFFLSGRLARHFAFKIVRPGDRPVFIILTIQTFTVVFQVAVAGILAVWRGNGFTALFLPDYLTACCLNFIMALPAQLLIAGPVSRKIFRLLFRRANA